MTGFQNLGCEGSRLRPVPLPGAARYEHLSVRKNLRVGVASTERHRGDLAPGRRRRVEVDDFGGVGRRIAATHHQDLAGLIHDRLPGIAVNIDDVIRDRRPGAGTCGVEIAGHEVGSRVEYPAVRRQMHARIQVEQELRIRQVAPAVARDIKDLRKCVLAFRVVDGSRRDQHIAVAQDGRGRVPPTGVHLRYIGPLIAEDIVGGRVCQPHSNLDVAADDE